MIDPRDVGRPLDEREAREFERLVASFSSSAPDPRLDPRPTPEPAAPAPSPVAAPGPAAVTPRDPADTGPLTWRQALLVLVASAFVAALTATLPSPLNLWAPVAVLVAVSLGAVVWGRRGERRP